METKKEKKTLSPKSLKIKNLMREGFIKSQVQMGMTKEDAQAKFNSLCSRHKTT